MPPWPELEEDLRAPVATYLQDQGYRVRHEVWINGRIADLYGFKDASDTIAVELKLTAWRQAVGQAKAYQLGALHSYVALPHQVIPRVTRELGLLKRHNVGLLAVAPEDGAMPAFQTGHQAAPPDQVELPTPEAKVRRVLEAQPSDRYLPFLGEKILRDATRPKRVPTVLPLD